MNLGLSLVALLIILASVGLLYWLTRRIGDGPGVGLRPLAGYRLLRGQTGRAIESGQGVHFAFGRGSLNTMANPASLAALAVLDYLAVDACANDMPPLVSVGDGTLLLAGQDSLRGAYRAARRSQDFSAGMVQYQASADQPMTYAAGASYLMNRGDLGSNLALGRFGSELAIMAETAQRQNMEQVVGSDDPIALAVGLPTSNSLLIGEEFFAAGAYLQGKPAQIASLQLQDILRLVAVAGLILAALFNLVVG
ncbi:MAG: DUF6754 domain-containing protein [Candidatus Promineifilaceae bacterium]